MEECEAIREITGVVRLLGVLSFIGFIFWLAYKAGDDL